MTHTRKDRMIPSCRYALSRAVDWYVRYVRRWAYETQAVGRLGRSFAQFRVLPFTHGMHSMVEDKHASLPYNNVNLVTYCGADVCAQTARVGWNAMAASPSCSVPSRAPQTIGLF